MTEILVCNGYEWNKTYSNNIIKCDPPPEEPKKSCIFQKDGFCGWSNFPIDDLIWKINNNGLYFDNSIGVMGDSAAIFSPVYPNCEQLIIKMPI